MQHNNVMVKGTPMEQRRYVFFTSFGLQFTVICSTLVDSLNLRSTGALYRLATYARPSSYESEPHLRRATSSRIFDVLHRAVSTTRATSSLIYDVLYIHRRSSASTSKGEQYIMTKIGLREFIERQYKCMQRHCRHRRRRAQRSLPLHDCSSTS